MTQNMTQKEMIAQIAAMVAAANPKASVPGWIAEAQEAAKPKPPRELAELAFDVRTVSPTNGATWAPFKSLFIHNGKQGRNYREVRLDARYLRQVLAFLKTEAGQGFLKTGAL